MSLYRRWPVEEIFLCPVFLKREMAPKKVMGLFVGVPLAGNNNKTFCIYTGAFWVRAVRLSLGSRKVD